MHGKRLVCYNNSILIIAIKYRKFFYFQVIGTTDRKLGWIHFNSRVDHTEVNGK